MQESEIWKPILGYEGLYEVSNYGNIRSCGLLRKRMTRWGTMSTYYRKPHMMAVSKCSNGYLFVTLSKENKTKEMKLVHRLVDEAFLPNPNNLPCVNHKDESRTNDHVDNLEWCDFSYNQRYGSHSEKNVESSRRGRKDKWRPKYILQYSLDHKLIAVYPSLSDACRQTGSDPKSVWHSIYRSKHKRKAKTYYWSVLDTPVLPEEYSAYLVKATYSPKEP